MKNAINTCVFVLSFPRRLRRNRLENNTEHWNALLLSLRELIEWVIRKDTELTGLGPIRGDLLTLIKQQVRDHLTLASHLYGGYFTIFLFACRMISERSGGNWMTNGH